MKEKGFSLKKGGRSRQYPAETITDEDYTDDLGFLVNIFAPAGLELTARGINVSELR